MLNPIGRQQTGRLRVDVAGTIGGMNDASNSESPESKPGWPPGRWESVRPQDLPASPVNGDDVDTREIPSVLSGAVRGDSADLSGLVDLNDSTFRLGEDDPATTDESPTAAPGKGRGQNPVRDQDQVDGRSSHRSGESGPGLSPHPLAGEGSADATRHPAGAGKPIGAPEPRSDAASPRGPAIPRPPVDQQNIVERRQALEHHLKNHPTDLDSFRELAAIYREQQRPVEARRVLKQALQVFPDDADLLWEYEEAVLARSLQQYREVSDLAARLQTPETDRELKRSAQDWAMRRIEVCRGRLGREPAKVHLNVQLGEAYYDAEEYEDAIAVLSRVVDQQEWSSAAYLLIGKCHLRLGQDAEAMSALRSCALRRAVPAPPRIRQIALQMLVENADRLGIPQTAAHYRETLAAATQSEAAGPVASGANRSVASGANQSVASSANRSVASGANGSTDRN